MRKPANPFIISGYHSPAYFCDREDELAWLTDQVDNERNAVLHAWRRIGKTALLEHLFRRLESEKRTACVFTDLFGTSSLADANRRIASAIVQKFGETEPSFSAGLMKMIGSMGATKWPGSFQWCASAYVRVNSGQTAGGYAGSHRQVPPGNKEARYRLPR